MRTDGGGVEERFRGVSFSYSVSSPYDQRSIEKHNVLLWVREEEASSPSLSVFGLAPSQSGSRDREAPFAFHLLHLFFPPLHPRVGGEKLEGLSSSPPGKQRPAGVQAGSGSVIPHGVLTQDCQYFFKILYKIVFALHQLCWVQFIQDHLCVDALATSGPPRCEAGASERGGCMKQHEFDAMPLGAEQRHHEAGRLNTSRS